MKGIRLCGECANYDFRKHRCRAGASKEEDPRAKFYDDCPLEDVVAVIRCRDCKYWDDDRRCNGIENGLMREYTKPDDYCSYGERKDE